MAVLEGIGAIAGNFAQGYRQARQQKNQESLQQQQLQYEHANRLFQMADMVQDPHMKDTLFSSATQILDQLESPTKTKTNDKGIGSIFGKMFGIGHQKPASPAAAPAPAGPEQQPASPAAASPGSQTFGSLSDMFGSTLQAAKPAAAPAPAAAAPSGPVLPPVPDVDMSNVPNTRQLQAATIPFQPPTLTSRPGTPVTAPMAATPQLPAAPAAAQARHPQSGQPLPIPSAIEIRQRALKETQSPQYGFRDTYRQGLAEQQHASQWKDELLKVTEQHLAANPHIRTLAAADNDPDFGPEFRQIMDALGSYEAAGLIEKGTVENWMKHRFDDVRFGSTQYNANAAPKTISDAFGNQWRENPTTGAFDVPATPEAQVKRPEPRSFDQQVDLAFSIAPKSRGVSEWNTINGYFEKMEGADAARLTPEQSLQWKWLKDPAIKALPIQQKAEKFQALFNPVAPGVPILFNPTDPNSNRTTPSLLNRTNNAITPIPGAQGPGETFNAEKYMTPYQPPAFTNQAGRLETPQPIKMYDPDQLINSHAAGDAAVSVDTLRRLILDPSKFPPGGAKKVQDYIDSLPGPYPTLGKK